MLDTATLETIAPFIIAISAVVGLTSLISAEFHRRSLASGETRAAQYVVGGVTLALAVLAGAIYIIA